MACGLIWRSCPMVSLVTKDMHECSGQMRHTSFTVGLITSSSDPMPNLFAAYLTENYIENRSLRVHLWDTSDIPAVFVRCNCGDKPHPPSDRIAQMATAPGWQTFNATSPMQMAQPSPYPPSPAATMSPQMSMPLAVQANESQIIAAMSRMQLNPADPSHRAQFASIVNSRFTQQQQPAQPSARPPQQYASAPAQAAAYPMYITNTTGTPVNTTHGLIKTEARGIFISNLNFKSRERDIESFFSKAGPVVRVELQKDAAGKSKGNATVLYGSAESARNAVSMFHRREFMRMTLNVRADRERTAINAPASSSSRDASHASAGAKRRDEVTIVNGSQVS